MVGKIRAPRDLADPHPQIVNLLRADERRREKQKTRGYPSQRGRMQADLLAARSPHGTTGPVTTFHRRRLRRRLLKAWAFSCRRLVGR